MRWLAVLAALVPAACGDASSDTSASSSKPSASTAAVVAGSVTAAATTGGSTASPFASGVYRYALAVPAGWQAVAAKRAWDGSGAAPTHEDPDADEWSRPDGASVFAFAAPTRHHLTGYAREWIARTAAEHGDTCPNPPAAREPVTIGGDSGVLLAWDCGILIDIAVAVHDGAGYAFVFRDPNVHAATDPADHETFVRLLRSVKFGR